MDKEYRWTNVTITLFGKPLIGIAGFKTKFNFSIYSKDQLNDMLKKAEQEEDYGMAIEIRDYINSNK
jgi:hypothetical protein